MVRRGFTTATGHTQIRIREHFVRYAFCAGCQTCGVVSESQLSSWFVQFKATWFTFEPPNETTTRIQWHYEQPKMCLLIIVADGVESLEH